MSILDSSQFDQDLSKPSAHRLGRIVTALAVMGIAGGICAHAPSKVARTQAFCVMQDGRRSDSLRALFHHMDGHIASPETVHEAVAHALKAGHSDGRFATRKAVAAHYGVTQGTLIRWAHRYAGWSATQIAQASQSRSPTRRQSARMYGIRPTFHWSSKTAPGTRMAKSGWKVTVSRDKQAFTKCFAFSRHANPAAALRAALAWRDAFVATHRTPHKRAVASRINAANTSGVCGVSRAVERRLRKNGSISVLESWIATKPIGLSGKMTKRGFSIALYGEHEAFRMAVKARKAWEAQLRGYHVPHQGIAKVYAKQRMTNSTG